MSSAAARAPLFELEGARAVRADGSAWGPFTARADGARLTLIGDFSPWFAALAGASPFESGRALLAGTSLATALRANVAGLAPLDPAFPPRWTVRTYLAKSASLLGRERRATAKLVEATIARFELAHLGAQKLASLRVAERRVISLAAATLAEPDVLCCEDPLHRLDNAAQAYVETALERAMVGRKSVVSLSRLPPLGRARAFAERASAVLALDAGQLQAREPSTLGEAQHSRFILTVRRNAAALCDALGNAGLTPERLGSVGAYRALEASDDDFQRLRVSSQGTHGARAILEAAAAVDAPVVELLPDGEETVSSRLDG